MTECRCRFPSPLVAVGLPVGTGEGDRRRVVVQLGAVDVEGADHREDRLGDQGCSIRVEQAIEHPPDPVVVHRFRVATRQSEQPRLVGGGPLADPIERSVGDDDVGHHHRDDHGRINPEPGVTVRQVGVERLGQAHPLEEVLDDRQRSDRLTLQVEAFGSCHRSPP